MSQSQTAERLLTVITRRLRLAQWLGRSWWSLCVYSALMLAAILIGRLTGLFPQLITGFTVAAPLVLAVLTGALWPGRPSRSDAARAVDRARRTQDLFLAWVTQPAAGGDYAPLVTRDAERAAATVVPREVMPLAWERPALAACGLLIVLGLATWLVPTLDPFGKVAGAKEIDAARRQIEESRQQTSDRLTRLTQKDLVAENSQEVEQAEEKLAASLQKMQPGNKQANLQRLNQHQKEIGEIYRALQTGELRPLFDKMQGEQQLGQLHNPETFKQWQRELQDGSSESLQQKVSELDQLLEQIAKSDDPLEKSELKRQVQQQLKQLADFSQKKTGSAGLTTALQRAMEQLEAAQAEGMSPEALEAVQQSLELAQQELKQVAQSARDMEALEQALELISMAKQLNAKDQLAGEDGDFGMSLEDYAEMYRELMAGMSPGAGENPEGTGGRGQGGGAPVDEDDSVSSSFVDTKSKSALQQGKILMSMKSKGLSEAGEVSDQEYRQAVGEIRQSLEDVIEQEEIPPGYVGGIKKYFDTLEQRAP